MDLTKGASENLQVLLSLEKDDTLIADRGSLSKQDEFVQLDNIMELEYSIYFTFHQLLMSYENDKTDKQKLFFQLDEAIYKVYENKHLNKLIDTDEHFNEIIEDIDCHVSYLEDKYIFRSPLYKFHGYISPFMDGVCRLFRKARFVSSVLHETFYEMNKTLYGFSDDDNEETDDDNEETDDDNEETDDDKSKIE
jgi:hypothetical protein